MHGTPLLNKQMEEQKGLLFELKQVGPLDFTLKLGPQDIASEFKGTRVHDQRSTQPHNVKV